MPKVGARMADEAAKHGAILWQPTCISGVPATAQQSNSRATAVVNIADGPATGKMNVSRMEDECADE